MGIKQVNKKRYHPILFQFKVIIHQLPSILPDIVAIYLIIVVRKINLCMWNEYSFRVPVNKELLTGTDPVNKELLTGTVPVNKILLIGILWSITSSILI